MSDETLTGGAADDTLQGGAGNDVIEGGGGRNTAVFAGLASDYRFGQTFDGYLSVTDLNPADGDDGTDLVRNVETLRFADRSIDGMLGGDERANGSTAGGEAYMAHVAALADGGYVVVWSNGETVARRYDAEGRAVGAETVLPVRPVEMDVAGLPDGGYVLAWNEQDNFGNSFLKAIFRNADGSARGEALTISTPNHGGADLDVAPDGTVVVTWMRESHAWAAVLRADGSVSSEAHPVHLALQGDGVLPVVAALYGGGYVLCWTEDATDPDVGNPLWAVKACVVAADGTIGEVFRVNPDTGSGPYDQPLVVALADGGFAVAWTGARHSEGDGAVDIFECSFDADGSARGDAMRLDERHELDQRANALVANADGSFLVVWTSSMQVGFLARRIDAAGVPMGEVFSFGDFDGSTTFRVLKAPDLAVLADGQYVAAWRTWLDSGIVHVLRTAQDGDPALLCITGGASGDRIDLCGEGALQGAGGAGDDTYVVNSLLDRVLEAPGNGTDTVQASVGWTLGTALERLELQGGAAIDGTGNTLANLLRGNGADNVLDGRAGDDSLFGGAGSDTASYARGLAVTVSLALDTAQDTRGAGHDTLRQIENLHGSAYADRLDGNAGANRLYGAEGNDTLSGGAGDDSLDGGAGRNTVVYAGTAHDLALGWIPGAGFGVGIGAGAETGRDVLRDIQQIAAGGQSLTLVSGGEFRVNTDRGEAQFTPHIALLQDGGYAVTWLEVRAQDNLATIHAQRFDALDRPLGEEIRVDTTEFLLHDTPDVTALAGGGLVITWHSYGELFPYNAVHFQVFDAAGRPTTPDVLAYPEDYGAVHFGGAVPLATADGGFMLTGYFYNGATVDIGLQRYDALGHRVGAESRANERDPESDLFGRFVPEVAPLPDGGFVATWTSDFDARDGLDSAVIGRIFAADGTPAGSEFLVNQGTANYQYLSVVATLGGGGFVVAWISDLQDGSGRGIYARCFDADGNAATDEFRVTVATLGEQDAPRVCALADGGFAVTWVSYAGGPADVHVRVFEADGTARTTEVRVGRADATLDESPDIVATPDGGFLVTWQSLDVETLDTDIHAQRFDADGVALLPGVRGTNGIDVINLGGDGDLRAAGGRGDDTYVVNSLGDALDERTDEGSDTVESSISWTLAKNFEVLRLVGGGAIDASGNDAANALYGNAADNVLEGAGGADLIDGGAGIDVASYRNAAAGVQVSLAIALAQATGGAGIDTLVSIEGLHGSAFADRLGGDEGANAIWGRDGADSVLGAGGNDTLRGGGLDTLAGGTGDDTYVAVPDDVIVEAAREGRDTVYVSGSFALGANLENLVLVGEANASGTGNALANTITGNLPDNLLTGGGGNDRLLGGGGADTLRGGTGADTLQGGAGNDTYVVGTGDVLVEKTGAGIDEVLSALRWTLGAPFEHLVLTGGADIDGTGNALANRIGGNGGDNRLAGLGGSDTLNGGGGHDTLAGGGGADVFAFSTPLGAARNLDLVTDYVHGTDHIQLDRAVFTAFGSPSTIGSALFASGDGLAAAPTSAVRLVYDTASGTLYYDADGQGGAAAIAFARLGAGVHPVLSAADFLITG